MANNIITLTDSYKLAHYNMYPDGIERVLSYFESRNGAKFNNTVFFGLQYLIKEYLEGKVVTLEKIEKAKAIVDVHMGADVFNYEGWKYILDTYNGYLPIEIKAVEEGSVVPTNNVLMTVVNTDDKCFWLTNYLETLLSHVWASITVATLSRATKLIFKDYLLNTTGSLDGIDFMLHDFGFRGVSSIESAGICGAGHLINFQGTDTLVAIETAMDYYYSGVCAYSVHATEHSIMTAKGEEGEFEVFESLLDKYPNGILSIVIDSYNYKRFISEYAEKLKGKILNRNGKTVFRPDSGAPVPTTIDVLKRLEDVFGSTVNEKGFTVLNEKVGALWGDGIDYEGIENILYNMKLEKWSASNIVFGMGGGLLQKVNRDQQRFAFKSSAQRRNGVWHDIYKNPLDKSKTSKRGKQYLYQDENGKYETTNVKDDTRVNQLKTVFKNGKIIKEYTFERIRKNARI